jgi:hypothetical protein
VPLAAAIGVLVRYGVAQYYASPIYGAPPVLVDKADAPAREPLG